MSMLRMDSRQGELRELGRRDALEARRMSSAALRASLAIFRMLSAPLCGGPRCSTRFARSSMNASNSGVAEAARHTGSWAARSFLGFPGLEEGALADLVAYPEHPGQDPDLLARPCVCILGGRMMSTGSVPITEDAWP
jgi:hypothetical protein